MFRSTTIISEPAIEPG